MRVREEVALVGGKTSASRRSAGSERLTRWLAWLASFGCSVEDVESMANYPRWFVHG